MKFSFQLLLAFLVFIANGLTHANAKNEFGIGIGSIYYSTKNEPKQWQYNIAFQKSHEVTTEDVKLLTLPAVYYTRFFNRRLQFRLHYQYAHESRKAVSYWDQSTYQNTETRHLISLGYYYSFWNPKYIQIAAGIGFDGYATYFNYRSSHPTQDLYKNSTIEDKELNFA